jgi:hypothetical protein
MARKGNAGDSLPGNAVHCCPAGLSPGSGPPPPLRKPQWRRALAELRALLADPDDTDQIGEATLLAFTPAQLGGRGQALLTLGAALEVWRTLGWRWLVYDFRAWRRGRRASWLVEMPWEELLPLPLATVRRLARVPEADEAHPGGVLRGPLASISFGRAARALA